MFFMSQKKFHWSDLKKILKNNEGVFSRELIAISMLLEGHKVDLAQIPSRAGFRQPGKIRHDLKSTFAQHEGIMNDGLVYWIPDLYEPKS